MATSSIGSDIISSLGIGVYNPRSIAEALANAETIGRKASTEESQTKNANKLTAYNTISSALQGLKVGLGELAKVGSFSQKALSSSDATAVSASMTSQATAGSYEVAVTQRAKAHTIATVGMSSQTTSIGSGTLTLSLGGSSQDITIGTGNDSLTGIKDSINNAKMGIAASVVNDGTGYRLVLTSQNTGAANTISMTSSDPGLSTLVTGVSEVSPAKDAIFKVNGLSLTSASNQITGVVEGVTLNLNKDNSSSTINIAADASNVKDAVKGVIEDYNAMKNILDNYTSYSKSEDDPTKGVLAGDSTVSQLRFQMRNMLNFKSTDTTAAVQSMADIGMKTQLDGSLTLDEAALDKMLAESPDSVAKLFASVAEPSSPLIRFRSATDRTNEGTFAVNITTVAELGSFSANAMTEHLATDPVTIAATNNTFKIKLNGTESGALTVAAGSYTKSAMATYLQNLINNDANLKAKDASLSVSFNSDTNSFDLITNKYGSAAKIEFTEVGSELSTQLGLQVGVGTAGKDVSGSLVKDGKNYFFSGTGQQVKVSSVLSGSPRDLEFDVLGNADGSSLTVTKGYASGLSTKIDAILNSRDGLVGNKITNITKSTTVLDDQMKKIEARYEALVQKYVYQFGMVNALQSQMSSLSDSLKSMFQKSSDD